MDAGDRQCHDMHLLNTDNISYQYKNHKKFLNTGDQYKKKKYIHACINERRHFTPFVASVDELIGVEEEATHKRISRRLTNNWKEPYSHTCGYVKNILAINLVRATHRCIRGNRVPASQIRVNRPQWEDGAGLHLFQ